MSASSFLSLKGPDVGYQRPYLVLLDRVREGGHSAFCRPAILDHSGLRAVIDDLEVIVIGHVAALIQKNIVDQARSDAALALVSVARGTVLFVKYRSLADGNRVPCEGVRKMLFLDNRRRGRRGSSGNCGANRLDIGDQRVQLRLDLEGRDVVGRVGQAVRLHMRGNVL